VKQISLKYLLLLIAIISGVLAWWRYDPFQASIQAVLSKGGSVSYDSRDVGISFAWWMPTMFETPFVTTHMSTEEPAEDLSEIYDEVRYLATQRAVMRIEFSRGDQAKAMAEHFEKFPIESRSVELKSRSPQSYMLTFERS